MLLVALGYSSDDEDDDGDDPELASHYSPSSVALIECNLSFP